MKVKVIQPSVVNKFQCIGKECKTTCCQGWRINIERDEFKKIKKSIKSEELQKLFTIAFITEDERDFRKSERYFMHLDENQACRFLTKEHLCGLQLDGGIGALPRTCIHFPRIRVENPLGFVQQCLDIGCEVVVHLLMEEKDGLMIEEKEIELERKLIIRPNWKGINRDIVNMYFDVQVLCVSILQNRLYTIPERLALLGIAMQKVDTMEKENKLEKLPMFVEKFINSISDEEHPMSFENFKKDDSKKAYIGLFLQLSSGKAQKRLRERFKIEKEVDEEAQKVKATFNLTEYLKSMEYLWVFMEGKEHYLENTLVMLTFLDIFPFGSGLDVWQNYCTFVVMYIVYLFYLSAYLDENSTDEDFVYCTVEVARSIFKLSAKGRQEMEEYLEKNIDISLAGMISLVL